MIVFAASNKMINDDQSMKVWIKGTITTENAGKDRKTRFQQ